MADWTDSNLGFQGLHIHNHCCFITGHDCIIEKLNFWSESASVINRLAFLWRKIQSTKPVVYLSMFYFFNDPRSIFASNYVITLALVYCVTGIAYVLANVSTSSVGTCQPL